MSGQRVAAGTQVTEPRLRPLERQPSTPPRRRSRPPLWWLVKHAAGRELRAKADTVRHSVPRQRVYA
jgi:hypothetical protein